MILILILILILITIDYDSSMVSPYNIPRPVNSDERVFVNDTSLEEVDDFKYLVSYIASTSSVRKGLAWKALQSLDAL